MNFNILYRGGPRIFERGGGRLGLPSKKGGPNGGPILSPMLKSLHRGTKGRALTPPPPPPGSATDCRPRCMRCATISIHQSLILGTMNRIQSVATAHTANSRADLWFAEATFLVSRPYISYCCRQPAGWQGLYSLSIVSRIQESRELIIES